MSRRLLGIMPGQRDKGARLGTFVRDIPGKHILSALGPTRRDALCTPKSASKLVSLADIPRCPGQSTITPKADIARVFMMGWTPPDGIDCAKVEVLSTT